METERVLTEPRQSIAENVTREYNGDDHKGVSASRLNWLRAGVLGANDGIVSTASLVAGVAAATAAVGTIVTAGLAGLLAGASSMAAGEYVSVSSQRDAERASLMASDEAESSELTNPWHAAIASFGSFAIGAAFPLLSAVLAPDMLRVPLIFAVVVLALVLTGSVSARLGGAQVSRGVLRNVVGGLLAMAATYGIGTLIGHTIV